MKIRRFLMIATAGTSWAALLLQLPLTIFRSRRKGLSTATAVGNYLSFFTEESNLLLALDLSSSLSSRSFPWSRFFRRPLVKASVTLYIIVTAAVYWTILRPSEEQQGIQKFSDDILHGVVPGLYVAYWVIGPSECPLPWKSILYWLPYPFAYLLYTLIRGERTGWYPYRFLNAQAIGYGRVFRKSLMLVAAFSGIGSVLVGFSHWKSRRRLASPDPKSSTENSPRTMHPTSAHAAFRRAPQQIP